MPPEAERREPSGGHPRQFVRRCDEPRSRQVERDDGHGAQDEPPEPPHSKRDDTEDPGDDADPKDMFNPPLRTGGICTRYAVKGRHGVSLTPSGSHPLAREPVPPSAFLLSPTHNIVNVLHTHRNIVEQTKVRRRCRGRVRLQVTHREVADEVAVTAVPTTVTTTSWAPSWAQRTTSRCSSPAHCFPRARRRALLVAADLRRYREWVQSRILPLGAPTERIPSVARRGASTTSPTMRSPARAIGSDSRANAGNMAGINPATISLSASAGRRSGGHHHGNTASGPRTPGSAGNQGPHHVAESIQRKIKAK